MFVKPIIAVFAACAFGGLFGPADAQTTVETSYAKTEIIPETNGFVPGEALWFAIRQDVRSGWHVFWTNPGDAGLPLDLSWTLPQGFEVGEILHPVPEHIPVGPLASFAHEGTPVFLVRVTAPEDLPVGRDVFVELKAAWQVCEDICVPEEGRFAFALPVVAAAQSDARRAPLFQAARAALPAVFDGEAEFTRAGGAYVLKFQPPEEFSGEEVFFFPAAEGLIEPAGEQSVNAADGVVSISMTPGYLKEYAHAALEGVLTYVDAAGLRRGAAVTAAVAEPIVRPSAAADPAISPPGSNMAALFVLAFFGGLILNVMPCVFPIIFIKAAALMQSAQENPAAVRRHGALYAAGVLASFLLIGGVLLALRAGGEQLGWGFHLQSPVVVALSAYVLFLVGLNLSGLFEIGESLAGAGESLAARRGGLGAFFTGVLAVIVAAPCIGPLLTAPMGAALLLPSGAGLLIFAVMAVGLAAPYLALSFAPSLGRLLPRPGPWTVVFKQALAFPVFAAAAYFLWIFSQQSDGAGLAVLLTGAVLLAFAAWLFALSKGEGARALAIRGLSALAALGALAPLTRLESAETTSAADRIPYGAFQAEPYDAAALAAYRAEKTPVFVDFTAAWCVTCQFDKMTVLSRRELKQAFDRKGVVFMVADWTVRDPEITAALQSFGASGVPLYVYYPAGGPAKVLSPPLSKRAILDAISGA